VVSSPAAPTGADGTSARFTHLSVTTEIENVDANGFASDLLNDGLGSYANGVSGVTSILTENGYNGIEYGDWQFATSTTARRIGISLDAEDAVQPGDPAYLVPATPPFWGTQLLSGGAAVKCTFINRSMLAMTAGSSFTCPLLNHFDVAGVKHGRHPAESFTGHPETTDVQIVCNAADATGCNDWFIEPIGQDRAIGRLSRQASKPNKPNTHIGTFYIRFRVHITRP
jgi:hypothetical protein